MTDNQLLVWNEVYARVFADEFTRDFPALHPAKSGTIEDLYAWCTEVARNAAGYAAREAKP